MSKRLKRGMERMPRLSLDKIGARLLLGVILAGVAAISVSIVKPVYAIDAPDTLTINAVYAYRHCRMDDDQLYIVDYNIAYTGDNPDENITEAFLVRLMNGTTELGSTAPYAYYDDGYARGIAAIYFTSADAPTWQGSYTMVLTGNPTLDWGGDPPSTSVSTFDLWSSSTGQGATEAEVTSRVLYFADLLEVAWSVDLIETVGSGSWLTSYGEDYFSNSIPYLSEICPLVYSASLSTPTYERRDYSQAYATTLRNSVSGTPLDVSDVADLIPIDDIWFTTTMWIGMVCLVVYFGCRKIGSLKPALLLAAPLLAVGALLGWVDLVVVVIAGAAAIGLTAYAFFYQKASA